MTIKEKLQERFRSELKETTALALADQLARDDSGARVVELMDELEEVSFKAMRTAIEGLPELQRRAGLSDVVQWLDLGIALAQSSGAAALKYFKESPIVMGLIEPPKVRPHALTLALELSESDPNVALDFFKRTPELLTVLPVEKLGEWAEIGLELSRCDYVLGIEFLRQVPSVAAVLPVDQVRPWTRFGMKLVTQNSFGKTDYVGTLEFFRTSPSILGDIEEVSLRGLVLTFGDQLAERDPQVAITFLAEAPGLLRRIPSAGWSRRILRYGVLVAERDAHAALEYARRGPEVLALLGEVATTDAEIVGSDKFESWFKGGMEVLEYSAEGGRAYFSLETKKALVSVEEASSGVALRQVARSLKLFVQGLCGMEVSIQSIAEPPAGDPSSGRAPARATVSADGRTLKLPSMLRRYPTREENARLYLVMAAHEAGHLEFGTYRLALASLSDLVRTAQERYGGTAKVDSPLTSHPAPSTSPPSNMQTFQRSKRGDVASVGTLADVFQLYPQPALIRDLWTVLEDARVEYLLQHEYEGLAADLAALAREAVRTRSLSHGMSVREMIVDALLLLTTGGPEELRIPDSVRAVVDRVWSLAQGVLRPDASAEESVRVADHIYVALEEMIMSVERNAPEEQDQEADPSTGPLASDSMSQDYRPVVNWAYRGDMNLELITWDPSMGSDAPSDRAAVPDREAGHADPVSAPSWAERAQERNAARRSMSGMEQEAGSLEGPGLPDSEAREQSEVKDDRRGLHQPLESGERTFVYDEWDGVIRDYRSRWCRVMERWAAEGENEFSAAVLAEQGPSVRLLRRYFESMRPPGLRRVQGQPDGEDLDMDAIVRRRADQAAQAESTDRIYIRRERRERDVAVVFLVDLSGSTSRQVDSKGRRVIDVEKEGLVLLTEAMEALGDQYAVYGYSGRGREQVDFVILKDFQEAGRGPYLNRIGTMAPLHQNRDGAAIRHATRKLVSQQAKVRLLVLISDGKPLDDEYADEYALEDTKMALREARMCGIEPFCITVDREAGEYLKRMYGEVRYLIIDRIASLPERLPRIYKGLTS